MSKRTETPKAIPTTSEALAKIKFDLQGTRFVWHTLCRIINERTGCGYDQAEKIGQAMLVAGSVVSASPIGLTETQTFQLND